MNRAAAWSVRGVGRETREVAEEAARRAGMNLGEWLDEVVAEQAAEQGVDPEDFNPDERLDAIGDRLSDLARREEPRRDPLRYRRPREEMPDEPPARRPMPARPQADAGRAEALLEAAIAKFESRAVKNDERTARAIDSVATWIERSQVGRQDEKKVLDAVVDRLDGIDERIARQQTKIAAAVARPDDMVQTVVNRLDSIEKRLSGQLARQSEAAARPDPQVERRIAETARELDERMNELAKRLERSEKERREAPPPAARPRLELLEAVTQISRRRQQLDSRESASAPDSVKHGGHSLGVGAPAAVRAVAAPERVAAPPDTAARSAISDTLHSEIKKLSQRLDEIRSEQNEKRATPPVNIDGLRAELAAMSRSLADLAPRNAVVALEGAMRDLSQRISKLREGNTHETLLPPLEGLVAELREALRAHDPRPATQALEREIRAVGAKVEGIAHAAINPLAFERIRQQTEEVRNLLAAAALRPVPLDRLEKQIGDLADRVDRLALSPTPQFESAQVVALLSDARAQIERSTPTAVLNSIEGRLEQIAVRIDQALARPAPVIAPVLPGLDELSRRIDGMRQSMESRPAPQFDARPIEDALKKLAAKLESQQALAPDNRALEALLREISAKIDHAPRHAGDNSVIEGLLRDLGARIDRRTSPIIDTAPLEQVLRTLGERPVEIDTTSLERMIGEIRAKLDEPAPIKEIDTTSLERMIGEIRAKLDEPAPIKLDTRPLEGLVRELGARLSATPAAIAVDTKPLEQLMREFDAKLTASRPTVQDMQPLEAMLREINAKLDRPTAPIIDQNAFESMIHDLGARIDQRSNPVIDTRPLEQTLRALHDKLDIGATPQLNATLIEQAVEAISRRQNERPDPGLESHTLSGQIASIHDRLDLMQSSAVSNGALEQMVGDLLAELDQIRKALPDGSQGAHLAADIDQRVSHEIANLRAEQSTADRRVQSTLSTVQDMLEKLVERIGQVEEDTVRAHEFRPREGFAAPAGERAQAPPLGARPFDAFNSSDATIRDAPVFAPPRSGLESPLDGSKASKPSQGALGGAPAPLRSLDGTDFLIEPGSGAPARSQEWTAGASATPKTGINAHIAAARRAAQAALAESAAEGSAESAKLSQSAGAAPRGKQGLEQAKAFFSARRRPLLLGLALFTLVTLAIVSLGGSRHPNVQKSENEALTPPKTANLDRPEELAAAPKNVVRALDPTPVGSITPPSETAPNAKTTAPAPVEMVASIPASAPQSLRDAAAAGEPAAQYELASRLAEGRTVPRDPHAASQWFERAAQQGLAPAQYRLGALYEKGVGVTRDVAIAKSWYKKAADAGNARAMHNLAVLSAEAVGVRPDYSEAAGWFRKAAQLGVKDSQYNLAILFARGMGISQDLGQSWLWFSLAAQQGDLDAAKKRDEVAAKMDAKALTAANAALADFHTVTPSPAANDVPAPPGGWDAAKASSPQARQAPGSSPHPAAL